MVVAVSTNWARDGVPGELLSIEILRSNTPAKSEFVYSYLFVTALYDSETWSAAVGKPPGPFKPGLVRINSEGTAWAVWTMHRLLTVIKAAATRSFGLITLCIGVF